MNFDSSKKSRLLLFFSAATIIAFGLGKFALYVSSHAPVSGAEASATYPVSFRAGDVVTTTTVSRGTTVLQLMNELKQQGTVSFSGKEAPGLGFYVDEVNGVKSDTASNYYWTLYINNALSQVGVSDALLEPNDSVEWRYESF